jgi:hypothetical protein
VIAKAILHEVANEIYHTSISINDASDFSEIPNEM